LHLYFLQQESFSSRLRSLQDETSTNIYISNLPLTMDEEGLQELFKPFQTISNRILRDPQSGMSRGVGFARLADRQSASAIIDKYNGHSISGSSAPLQVRFADSPAQKRLKSETSTTTNNSKKQQQPPMPLGASTSTGLRNTRDLLHGFPNRSNMMPITPETMLGIAPSSSVSHG
jgi:RNA recognition motif-containing protein